MKTFAAPILIIAALGLPDLVLGQPVVRDSTSSIYAVITDPVRMAFAPDGTLFVGRDAGGSGGGNGDAVKIHRVGPGGSPVTEYGNLAISDPDALIVDVLGTVSGTPGAVLVGGVHDHGLNLVNHRHERLDPDSAALPDQRCRPFCDRTSARGKQILPPAQTVNPKGRAG